MADEKCSVCSAPLSSLGREETALAQHMLDYNDPHRTLELIPSIELGYGPPASAQGHLATDMYIDLSAQRIYVVGSVAGGSTGWIPATAPAGITTSQLPSALGDYVTNTALSERLSGYVQTSSLSGYARAADLASYVTAAEMQEALQGCVQAGTISEYGFVDSASLASELASYVTERSMLETLANGYLSQAAADDRYLKLSDYSAPAALPSGIMGAVFRSPITAGTYPERDLDIILRDYLTRADAGTTYVTPAWLETNGYLDADALSETLESYVTGEALSDVLDDYVTQAAADDRYLKLSDYSAPAALPSGIMGAVFRSPITAGTYPERDLDIILRDYLTRADAGTTYLSLSAFSALNCVTQGSLTETLSSYVSSSGLANVLAGYLTKTEAGLTYVTPQYLVDNEYLTKDDPNSFVYRNGQDAELDLDAVLAAWPAQSVGPVEPKPPSGTAVHLALAQRDSAISAIQTQLSNISVTGGQSNILNVITEPLVLVQNSPGLVPVEDKAVNTIVMAGDWLGRLAVSSGNKRFSVAVPDAYQDQTVARDFFVVLDFPSSAGTGQVPFTFDGFFTREGAAMSNALFSHMQSGLRSLTGISYGMKVVFAVTEFRPGQFAVTRKNLYEV